MPEHKAKIQEANIVIRGNFNPQIFQPYWFGIQGLIRKEEVNDANVKIIHPDIASFSLGWMVLEVTRDRFLLSTSQDAYTEVTRDLALGTFTVLEHTPLKYLGVNVSKHFEMINEEQWHALGDILAPKGIWKDLFHKPGMRSLTMEESSRPDGLKGYTRVTVEPSVKIHPGVYFLVNDHYSVKDPESVTGAEEILAILESEWYGSVKRSNTIIDSLLEVI